MLEFLMGNQAIARGAWDAGVNVVCGYPGTPSTEILETVAKQNDGRVYVEWSVNEKAALELAAGAAYAGARALVTMKQVGLNVAADPLMSLAYVGVKGGLVIVAADDPGPISSQTEQDTRQFARFCKIPVFDPQSPQEAYDMVGDAFTLSERIGSPVLLRPTTRVCHGCAVVACADAPKEHAPEGFVRDPARWVIFPRSSYLNHLKIEKRNPELGAEFSRYARNRLSGGGRIGLAAGGVSRVYLKEALRGYEPSVRLLEVATPFPFPEALAETFLRSVDEVWVYEELDPVIERELVTLCGKLHLMIDIHGKLDGSCAQAGENSVEGASALLSQCLPAYAPPPLPQRPQPPALAVRPPVLCAGCPHRASFCAVKRALHGRKYVACGDIGCYTLGNAMPLDMVDTCLCMGADVTMAQGLRRAEPDRLAVAFIGDSTFFASGITGVINAVYNETDLLLIVLDNSTTAMTGHQPHPGTGITMMGHRKPGLSIEAVLTAVGVGHVATVNPLSLAEAVQAVRDAADLTGVRAVVFRSPCIAVAKGTGTFVVTDRCIHCRKCVTELGCPAIAAQGGEVVIEPSLCFGCGLCAQVCPVKAIERGEVEA